MKFLKLKSVLLAIVLVCSLSSFKAENTSINSIYTSCGTIVINDDIMLTEADAPSNSIEFFIIESDNGEIFTFEGCGENNCSTNISRLPAGHYYDVTIITADCTFEDGFYKK